MAKKKEQDAQDYLQKHNIDPKVVIKRFEDLCKQINQFLIYCGVQDYVDVNISMLENIVIDYFVDIVRIKEFHNIKLTNFNKIYGYTTYWILKRKPIQVIDNEKCRVSFINEKFAACYFISNIFSFLKISPESQKNNLAFINFIDLLKYNFKYRDITAKNLEIICSSFVAGVSVGVNCDGKK